MTRGELYRVRHPSAADPKPSRVFVVISRNAVIESRYSTVICAPVYSAYHGLVSQVAVGVEEGLKHESSIHCDELVSLPKTMLTDYVGSLGVSRLEELSRALAFAVGIQHSEPGA